MLRNKIIKIIISPIFIASFAIFSLGQTTEFTYQGRLLEGLIPANAVYDFDFSLFDAESGGTLLGTQQQNGVSVVNGIFTVRLDFGGAFDGAPRWLEIAVRPTGAPAFTLLNPRQPISSSPYAIKSLTSNTAETATNATNATNASQLGGIAASEYVVTADPRMSDARPPTPGSPSYIQNQNVSAQASSGFHISGNGTADGVLSGNVVNAATQYNIGGQRVISLGGTDNTFVGRGAGIANTGFFNTFVGHNAGNINTTGQQNSFFGRFAGSSNTTGSLNAFFGDQSGQSNISGQNNAYFGFGSGSLATGSFNAFFGSQSGVRTTGNGNAFFGYFSGPENTIGADNAFFGSVAGRFNTEGVRNSFVGAAAGFSNTTGSANSFFGFFAGRANTTGFANSFAGAGAGESNTTGAENSFLGRSAGFNNSTGNNNSFVGRNAGDVNTIGSNNTAVGAGANFASNSLTFATAIGSGAVANLSNSVVLGRAADTVRIPGNLNLSGTLTGTVVVGTGNGGTGVSSSGAAGNFLRSNGSNWTSSVLLAGDIPSGSTNYVQNRTTAQPGTNFNISGTGQADHFVATLASFSTTNAGRLLISTSASEQGTLPICLAPPNNRLNLCSSSLRYKSNVSNLTKGIDLIKRLRPVTFDWKDRGTRDLGLIAEEVDMVEPLLTFSNDEGQIQGVKYDRIGVILINVVTEQQQQIEQQQTILDRQQAMIDALRSIICKTDPQAGICKEDQ